jgi:hypothetical protein
MARHEQDREDLLAEAKALVERASLRISLGSDSAAEEVVVGFRRDGCLAIYFAADWVYQFTSTGQLRRAYLGDLLYKADRGTLVSLRRVRAEHAIELINRPLDQTETVAFLVEMQAYLRELLRRLSTNNYELVGQVPADVEVVKRVITWLQRPIEGITVAQSPRSG